MRRQARWTVVLLSVLLAAVIAGVGCGPGSDDDDEASADESGPLKIGVMNPFSGDFAFYGEEVFRGYELAAEEANANGGVMDRQVELVKGDATTPEQGVSQAERLASSEEVDLFTGTYISAVSEAASETAARDGKLYWETNALAEDLTDRDLDNFIRVGPSAFGFADVSVEAMGTVAEALGKDIGDLSVWVEHEDSIYGTSIAERQAEQLKKEGAEVVGVGAHDAAASDVTDSVLRAKSADPDVWLMTGYVPDGNLLLQTARDQGFAPDAIMLTGTGDTKETLDAIGAKGLEGVLVVSYPRPDVNPEYGPGAAEYLQAYVDKYGSQPRAPQSMTAYTGLKVLFQALDEAGSAAPEDVRAVAEGMDEPEQSLPTGYGVDFDEHFQNTRALPTVIQWQNGKQVTVLPEAAAEPGSELQGLPLGG
ncbi:MAG: ABC transporter substrate-binding protein [Solirubrobacterales bacterium]|nr:ABC transporter substrate-binding protein [Solirubrobacterales bacterium]